MTESTPESTPQVPPFDETSHKRKILLKQRLLSGAACLALLGFVYWSVKSDEVHQVEQAPQRETVFAVLPKHTDKEAFTQQFARKMTTLKDQVEKLEKAQDERDAKTQKTLSELADSISQLNKELDSKLQLINDDLQAHQEEVARNRVNAVELPDGDIRSRLTDRMEKQGLNTPSAVAPMGLANMDGSSPQPSSSGLLLGMIDLDDTSHKENSAPNPSAYEAGENLMEQRPAPQPDVVRPPALRVDDALDVNRAQGQNVKNYIPAGSFVKATLLSGVYAGTGPDAPTTPTPVLLSIKNDTVLPNDWNADLTGCFLMGNATGELSSERVQIRLERLSCVRQSGDVIDLRVKGLVTGEDGKVGLHGRLVSRNGKAIASAVGMGFLSGLGQAVSLSAQEVRDGSNYDTVHVSNPWKAGFGKGAADSMNQITRYYLKLAERIFPVLEVDAGRVVDVIFSQGVLLGIKES